MERLSVLFGNFFVFWFLAYISGPESYASIAIVSAIVIVGNSLADGGMYTALIRLGTISRNDYTVALLINSVAGIMVMFGLIGMSSPITRFFDHVFSTDILLYIAPIFFVYALGVCPKVELVKNFKIRSLAVATTIAVFVSVLVMLTLHFVFLVKPLELSIIYFWSFSVFSTIMYHVKSSIRFKIKDLIQIIWRRSDDFYRFASTALLVSLLNSLFTNAYTLLIGNFYSPKDISFLSQATRLSQIAPSNLSMIISRANYPKLVQLRESPIDFFRFISSNLNTLTIISIFISGTGSLLSEQIVAFLLGAEWSEMSEILGVLFLVMGFIPVNALLMQVIQTVSGSKIYISVEAIKKINFSILLYCVAGHPAIYFCYGLALTSVISLVLHFVVLSSCINANIFDFVKKPFSYIAYGSLFFLFASHLNTGAYFSALVFVFSFTLLIVFTMRQAILAEVSKIVRS